MVNNSNNLITYNTGDDHDWLSTSSSGPSLVFESLVSTTVYGGFCAHTRHSRTPTSVTTYESKSADQRFDWFLSCTPQGMPRKPFRLSTKTSADGRTTGYYILYYITHLGSYILHYNMAAPITTYTVHQCRYTLCMMKMNCFINNRYKVREILESRDGLLQNRRIVTRYRNPHAWIALSICTRQCIRE